MEILKAIGKELAKDKWLIFFLIIVLLIAFIRTSNEALEQLLVTAVGGFIGLMRSGSQVTASEGSTVISEEPKA